MNTQTDNAAAARKIMLGTAGHVDHGKTALVKLLTGCETDRLAEEKRRGLTIELGYAPCRLADERIAGIIDAPGHVDFIRNMVAGAHAVDLAILCVAADDGVMPQTREHAAVLTLMGVRKAVAALTRRDLVDAERLAAATAEVRDLLAGTPLADSPVCPLSNITGEGFPEFMAALLAAADACRPTRPPGDFRMWIDRVFNVRGFGLIATGIPTTGEVSTDDKLYLPGRPQPMRLRNLQVYGINRRRGACGQCLAMNLTDIEPDDLARGKLLTLRSDAPVSDMVEASLTLLPTARPLADYARVHLHIGTAHLTGAVALLEGKTIDPGGSGLVQLRLEAPLAAAPGERFIIRAQQADRPLTTVGGGVVLDACGLRLKRRRNWTLDKLRRRLMSLDDPSAWAAAVLSEQADAITAGQLAAAAWLGGDQATAILDELVGAGRAVRLGDGRCAANELVRATAARLAERAAESEALAESHAADELGLSDSLVRAAIENAVEGGRLRRTIGVDGRNMLAKPEDHAPDRAKGDDNLSAEASRLEALLREVGLAPPLPDAMAAHLGITKNAFVRALGEVAAAGRCVRLDRKVIMHAEAIERARRAALDLFGRRGFFETVEFRDALGVSRKYAIALLDWLDGQRFTTRNGQFRRPGSEAKKRMGD